MMPQSPPEKLGGAPAVDDGLGDAAAAAVPKSISPVNMVQ